MWPRRSAGDSSEAMEMSNQSRSGSARGVLTLRFYRHHSAKGRKTTLPGRKKAGAPPQGVEGLKVRASTLSTNERDVWKRGAEHAGDHKGQETYIRGYSCHFLLPYLFLPYFSNKQIITI